jgi:hypothetical protein
MIMMNLNEETFMQFTMCDETSRTTSICSHNAATLPKPIEVVQHGLSIHTSLIVP